MCADCVGPHKIPAKNPKKPLVSWAVTMIDPAAGWFEMAPPQSEEAIEVTDQVEIAWLTGCPKADMSMCDGGTEFMNQFAVMTKEERGKGKLITVRFEAEKKGFRDLWTCGSVSLVSIQHSSLFSY